MASERAKYTVKLDHDMLVLRVLSTPPLAHRSESGAQISGVSWAMRNKLTVGSPVLDGNTTGASQSSGTSWVHPTLAVYWSQAGIGKGF